jgi:hypothetical protein
VNIEGAIVSAVRSSWVEDGSHSRMRSKEQKPPLLEKVEKSRERREGGNSPVIRSHGHGQGGGGQANMAKTSRARKSHVRPGSSRSTSFRLFLECDSPHGNLHPPGRGHLVPGRRGAAALHWRRREAEGREASDPGVWAAVGNGCNGFWRSAYRRGAL